jgi:hypothetical protein
MAVGSGITLKETAPTDIPTPPTGKDTIFVDSTATPSPAPAYKNSAGVVASLRGATGPAGPAGTGSLGIVIDGAGSTISTGVKGFLYCPRACTITAATLLSTDPTILSSTIVVNVWKRAYASYPPTVADKITASAPPTLAGAIKTQDTTLTGWTTAIAAGDVLAFNVDSASAALRVQLQLTVTF